MVFVDNLAEKYVGKAFEIDCFDIEIHRFQDDQPPLFKGPGVIRGEYSGPLFFKLYNQIQIEKKIFDFLKQVQSGDDPEKNRVRLFAKDYDGVEWIGSWSIPRVNLFQIPSFTVHGEFNQLATRIQKVRDNKLDNLTELVFAGTLNLPFSGVVHEKIYHGPEVISTRIWSDHHCITLKNSTITFQESSDQSKTHVKGTHAERFTAPYVENWITEALIFITARMIYPRMVIRHFHNDALVCLRETPQNIKTGMPPPFFGEQKIRECLWEVFRLYLLRCEESQSFDFLEITKGFSELILASKGTVQGFLISLSLYVENCINQIFASPGKGPYDSDEENRKHVKELIDHVDAWEGDDNIKDRAKGMLSMLNTPPILQRMDILVRDGVISEVHKKVWQRARPYLAHGGMVDFSKGDEFWHFRNYLISMVYRLTCRILGYKGMILDYDGNKFEFVNFNWINN